MELQISNTKEELLLNTINHFNSNNRLVSDDDQFSYINLKTGRRSSIGRELTESSAAYINYWGSVDNACVFGRLPDRLKKMSIEFLRDIQALHDLEENWHEKGLSDDGYDNARNIIKKYNLDLKL